MAHLTVVQHQNSDVFHALSRIFDAPAVSERRSDAFQITNAADAAARALFIGGDFVYDDSGMIAGGEIENIITFSGDLVAAQIIGTALPAGDIGRFLATPQRNSSDMIRDGLFAGATFDFFSPLAPQWAHKALFLPCQIPQPITWARRCLMWMHPVPGC